MQWKLHRRGSPELLTPGAHIHHMSRGRRGHCSALPRPARAHPRPVPALFRTRLPRSSAPGRLHPAPHFRALPRSFPLTRSSSSLANLPQFLVERCCPLPIMSGRGAGEGRPFASVAVLTQWRGRVIMNRSHGSLRGTVGRGTKKPSPSEDEEGILMGGVQISERDPRGSARRSGRGGPGEPRAPPA